MQESAVKYLHDDWKFLRPLNSVIEIMDIDILQIIERIKILF